MQELWKSVKGYEGLYEVSNTGRVKSVYYKGIHREKIMNLQTGLNGYHSVMLSLNAYHRRWSVHRLVAYAFLPIIKGKKRGKPY